MTFFSMGSLTKSAPCIWQTDTFHRRLETGEHCLHSSIAAFHRIQGFAEATFFSATSFHPSIVTGSRSMIWQPPFSCSPRMQIDARSFDGACGIYHNWYPLSASRQLVHWLLHSIHLYLRLVPSTGFTLSTCMSYFVGLE